MILRPLFDRIGISLTPGISWQTAKSTRGLSILGIILKVIIDNGLTPGFDVFDTPRAACGFEIHLLDSPNLILRMTMLLPNIIQTYLPYMAILCFVRLLSRINVSFSVFSYFQESSIWGSRLKIPFYIICIEP